MGIFAKGNTISATVSGENHLSYFQNHKDKSKSLE